MSAADVLAGRAPWAVEQGDVLDRLAALPDESVNCVVSSPPYWGLRDYGTATWEGGDPDCDHKKISDPVKAVATSTLGGGKKTTGHQQEGYRSACRCGATRVDRQIGLEPTPDAYVARMVAVFREVRRVLRSDGTCWVNLGDSYNNRSVARKSSHQGGLGFESDDLSKSWADLTKEGRTRLSLTGDGLKEKDLIGIPWRVAFALQADGWWLRSAITWCKPNAMPESVTDRPTSATEMLFLLTRSPRYAYDADAIREPQETADRSAFLTGDEQAGRYPKRYGLDGTQGALRGQHPERLLNPAGRNKRNWWVIPSEPYPDAHFATMPTALVEPCILAGSPAKTCPACGAPWARIVERTRSFESGSGRSGNLPVGKNGAGLQGGGATLDVRRGPTVSVETLGWEPTCRCDRADTVPGVVLDPFVGSGTVLVEALRHGRRGIGFDLSPAYVELARRRIVGDCPMFNGPEAAG